LLLLFNKHKKDYLQTKNTAKYPYFPSAMQPVQHREELPVPAAPEYLTFSDCHSNPEEDHGQRLGI
jgi:hypothetical protein